MLLARIDPMLLPMPRPMRNTARISENVYVEAPNSRLSNRVQITCAANAQKPDNAIATYTATRCPSSGIGDWVLGISWGLGITESGRSAVERVLAAKSNPSAPTAKLIAAATYVATFIS